MALGVYSNRIDWPGAEKPMVPGEAAEGELAKRQKRVTELKDSVERGRTRWQTALAGLLNMEKLRPETQAWYAEQLKMRKTGKDRDGKEVPNPVKVLVHKDGQLPLDKAVRDLVDRAASGKALTPPDTRDRLDKAKPPVFEDLADLTYTEDLVNQLKDKEEEIKKELQAIADNIEQEKKLTNQIKGVRFLLDEERVARRKSLAELKYLEPLLYNREVESQALMKRQRSLQAHLKELQSLGAAARQP